MIRRQDIMSYVVFIAFGISVCYAGICGESQGDLDFIGDSLDSLDDILKLTTAAEFESCCPNPDQVNVDGSGRKYFQSAHALVTLAEDNGGTPQAIGYNCSQYKVRFQISSSQSDENCCRSCTCYGDPVCSSFDNVKKMWIVCDARTPPNHSAYGEITKNKRCKMTKEMCISQKDQIGNTCFYKAKNPFAKYWNVVKRGSPCVPNPASPSPEILMYHIPSEGFSVKLIHGERGTISEALILMNFLEYRISARTCLVTPSNPFFRRDELSGGDYMWHLFDNSTKVSVIIRCVGNRIFTLNDVTNKTVLRTYSRRLNIESIADPFMNRIDSTTTAGFCVSSVIDTGLSNITNTQDVETSGSCFGGMENHTKSEIFRAICSNPSLPQSSIPHCIERFCYAYYYPGYPEPYECIRSLQEASDQNDILKLGRAFCRAVIRSQSISKFDECSDEWIQFSEVDVIKTYLSQMPCVPLSLNEVKREVDDCTDGISLAVVNEDGSWDRVLTFPRNVCPDRNIIELDRCSYPDIFEKKIRLVQYKPSHSCGLRDRCASVAGFLVNLDYEYPTQPTSSPTVGPTTFPTNFPTFEPTNNPTAFPTTSPSQNPSSRPTMFPTVTPSTNLPTLFPTTRPSEEQIQPTTTPTPQIDTSSSSPTSSIECTRPLCGSESSLALLKENSFPEYAAFSSCCPRSGFLDQVSCVTVDSIATRSYGYFNSYCGTKSAVHRSCSNRDELKFKVYFSTPSTEEDICCKSCSCFGDPRCYSFDGKYSEFILCDGREIPTSLSERCIVRKANCLKQLDHSGNTCKWKEDAPNFEDSTRQSLAEREYSVTKNGSPCRYNSEESPPSTIEMYSYISEKERFSLVVRQFDRGYIDAVYISTYRANYSLTAVDCLKHLQSWEVRRVNSSAPKDSYNRFEYGSEVVWKFVESSTKIEVSVKCTGTRYQGDFSAYFMNIDYIKDPESTRTESGRGFCVTGVIQEKDKATTEVSSIIEENGLCEQWNQDVDHIMLRNSLRVITGQPMITTVGTSEELYKFCETHFAPSFKNVEGCVNKFSSAKTINVLFNAFCKSVLIKKVDQEQCVENLEVLSAEDGYIVALEEARDLYMINYNGTCEMNANVAFEKYKFGEKLLPCDDGVELQYRENGIWKTYLSVPSYQPPCQQYFITFSYGSNKVLFKNPIRVIQKYASEKCSKCHQISAVDFWTHFVRE